MRESLLVECPIEVVTGGEHQIIVIAPWDECFGSVSSSAFKGIGEDEFLTNSVVWVPMVHYSLSTGTIHQNSSFPWLVDLGDSLGGERLEAAGLNGTKIVDLHLTKQTTPSLVQIVAVYYQDGVFSLIFNNSGPLLHDLSCRDAFIDGGAC